MKRILTIIISLICIYANSQTVGRFPYYSILQTYWGDSLRTSFDTDTVKWTTNQNYYSIDKPLYIMGNLVGIGGTLTPTVRLNAGDSSAYITTTTGNGVQANVVNNAGSGSSGYNVYNTASGAKGYQVQNMGENSKGINISNLGDNSTGMYIYEKGDNSTGMYIYEKGDNSKALDIIMNGSNTTGINIVSNYDTGLGSAINIDNISTTSEITGINIKQAGYAPALNITQSNYYCKAIEIHNIVDADAIIEIYNSAGVKEFQFRNGGEFETTGNITTSGNFNSKGAHIRADIDYTLPDTMTLTENVWQRIDLKDVGDVSNGITLTGDSILCTYSGSINLHFDFNLQNVASKEYEYRIRRNGVTLRTIKVTGASANVTRTINYVHKNIGTGYYSIELRSTSASPGDVIFYNGYCYAKMENIW